VAERLRVLVVDDDAPARRAIASFIARKGDVVREAEDGQSALNILEHEEIDVVLSDVRMPKLDGISLTRALRDRSEDSVVVLMTAFATIENVIAALREGAYDYLIKPIDPEQLSAALNRVRERLSLRRRVRSLTAAISARDALSGLVSGGPAMRAVLESARRAAQGDLPVLITGETGTGKDLLARAIHGLSNRAAAPLVVVNCAAVPEGQIDAELFGTTNGDGRSGGGKVREADRGTLLIDELNALPSATQGKLLRLLEEKVLDNGNGEATPIDVRTIAAAGDRLSDEVKASRFRADLYYRLRVIEINLPPLRDRREDIPHLVENFLQNERERVGTAYRITPEALSLLMAAPWPGNVRELENVVRAAVAMTRSDLIETEQLPPGIKQGAPRTSTLAEQVAAYERAVLRQALESVHGQVGRAAAALGVPERTLRRKMRSFGLAKEAFRKPSRSRSSGGVLGA
jgi:DNA-binding NtrC family response regulator